MGLSVILILNSIILVAIASLNFAWGRKTYSKDQKVKLVYGAIFGFLTIVLMNLSWGTETGVFYDSRTVLIAVVASSYSLLTTGIMIIIGSVYRIYLGGIGALAGVITIVCTAMLGIVFKTYIKPRIKKYFVLYYYIYGIVIHLFMLVYHFALPTDLSFIYQRIFLIAPIVLTLYPFMVAILSEIIRANDNRLEANDNLAESEERYRMLFDSMSNGVLYFDSKGIIVECNEMFTKILGSAKKELIGLDMKELPNKNLQIVLKEVLEGKASRFKGEYQAFLSGKELYLSIFFNPVFKNGEFFGGVGIVNDITDRERMKKHISLLSNLDDVTKLYNRKAFEEDIQSDKYSSLIPVEFSIVSIDNLQFYIDTMGFDEADQILIDFADCLIRKFKDKEHIYRITLNDFAIIRPVSKEKSDYLFQQIKKDIKRIDYVSTPLKITHASTIKKCPEADWFELSVDLRNKISSIRTYTKSRVTKNSIDVLMASLFEKSPRERQHSERVSTLAVMLGKHLNDSSIDINKLQLASVLHDIGKLNIDLSILNKEAKLTESEYASIKSHAESGFRILSSVEEYKDLAKIVLAHHEYYDGTGYPFGLKEELIPIESRIISIVDAYDAMVNDRPYREAMSKKEAIKEILSNSGTQFDPNLSDEFINLIQKTDN